MYTNQLYQRMRQKYNWGKLKNDYLVSNTQDVSTFIKQRLGKDTANDSNIANQTKGWKKEKEDLWNQSRNYIKNRIKNDYEIARQELIQQKWKTIDIIIQRRDKARSISELNKVLEVLKRELGEPLKIDQNNIKSGVTVEELVAKLDPPE